MSENHDKRVLSLTREVRFRRPRVWRVHPRYAYLTVGEPMRPSPPGAWVLELGPRELELGDGARQVEHLYRLATGNVVALDRALDEAEAEEVAEPQAMIAMNAYRSLEEAIYDDLGVMLHREQPGSPPFGIIRCPVCGCVSVNLVTREHVDVPFHNDSAVGVVEHVFPADAPTALEEFRAELYSAGFDARRLQLD